MSATFKEGLEVKFHPIQPKDKALLKELFYSHSEQTILQRYLGLIRHLPHEQVQKFVTLDYCNDFALVGLVPHEGRERMVGVGRYFRNPANQDAEIAITVHNDIQRCGIGTFLAQTLVKIAKENGIAAFIAHILAGNPAMMCIFRKLAGKWKSNQNQRFFRFDLKWPKKCEQKMKKIY
jgi:GNAT superfamily N-acetyltransferase